jgi:hypothetical protein
MSDMGIPTHWPGPRHNIGCIFKRSGNAQHRSQREHIVDRVLVIFNASHLRSLTVTVPEYGHIHGLTSLLPVQIGDVINENFLGDMIWKSMSRTNTHRVARLVGWYYIPKIDSASRMSPIDLSHGG